MNAHDARIAGAGKDTDDGSQPPAGESTQPGDGGQEHEPLLLRWTKGVTGLSEDIESPLLIHCETESGAPAVLCMGGREHRMALASVLDAQLVDVHRPCSTEGCGSTEEWDPSDPALWAWTRQQVAGVDTAPRWWCSSMCAWAAMARAGEKLAAQDHASEYELGGGL